MDCPCEEQLIRMKLQGLEGIQSLEFDIPSRRLSVYHSGDAGVILSTLETLDLGTTLISTESGELARESASPSRQRRLLWLVLGINFSFFAIEVVAGAIARSMGLVADSLDMLADSIVYGLALLAVGSTLARKKCVAKVAGYAQLLLAVVGFAEVIRRFVSVGEAPEPEAMIVVSAMALMANALCLYLMHRDKSQEAHMQASVIFTSNDVLVNAGVIIAGLLVRWLDSSLPDLIVGAVIFVLVVRGAYRILRIAR